MIITAEKATGRSTFENETASRRTDQARGLGPRRETIAEQSAAHAENRQGYATGSE
jgi:hypothetical protein